MGLESGLMTTTEAAKEHRKNIETNLKLSYCAYFYRNSICKQLNI